VIRQEGSWVATDTLRNFVLYQIPKYLRKLSQLSSSRKGLQLKTENKIQVWLIKYTVGDNSN